MQLGARGSDPWPEEQVTEGLYPFAAVLGRIGQYFAAVGIPVDDRFVPVKTLIPGRR